MADLSLRNTFNCFQNLWIFEVHRKCLLNWVPPSDASGANTCPRSARNWLIGMVSSPLISIKCKWKRTNCSSAHHLRASTVSNRSVRIAEAVPHQCRTAEIYCLWYMHDLRPNILVSIEQLENNSKHFLLLFWFCLQLIVCGSESYGKRELNQCVIPSCEFWKKHTEICQATANLSVDSLSSRLPFHFREVRADENLCNFSCNANACADDEKPKRDLMWNWVAFGSELWLWFM